MNYYPLWFFYMVFSRFKSRLETFYGFIHIQKVYESSKSNFGCLKTVTKTSTFIEGFGVLGLMYLYPRNYLAFQAHPDCMKTLLFSVERKSEFPFDPSNLKDIVILGHHDLFSFSWLMNLLTQFYLLYSLNDFIKE